MAAPYLVHLIHLFRAKEFHQVVTVPPEEGQPVLQHFRHKAI